jgi:methionyl aminopeptidase
MKAIVIKNKNALDKMYAAGQKLALVMQEVESIIVSGVNTEYIDAFVEERMLFAGLTPECKGYAGYRHATCISLNDIVIHGVPSKEKVLKSGDFVKIDVVGSYKGYCADMTRYFFIGTVNPVAYKMAQTAQRALDRAIEAIKPGCYLSDISALIQKEVERDGFGVVRVFCGHGIGKTMHEGPDIPNFGTAGRGPLLQDGMTLAIEPMIAQNSYDVVVESDGWTVRTVDGGLAAHVEDTIAVTNDGARILTRL